MAVLILAGTHAVTLTWLQTTLAILIPCLLTAFGQWIFSTPCRRTRLLRAMTVVLPTTVIVWDCNAWWGLSCWFW